MSGTAVLPPGSPPPPDPGYEDLCPNIDGIQNPVPSGMVKDGSGNCVAQVCTPGEKRQTAYNPNQCSVVFAYVECNTYGSQFNDLPQTGGCQDPPD